MLNADGVSMNKKNWKNIGKAGIRDHIKAMPLNGEFSVIFHRNYSICESEENFHLHWLICTID